MPPTAESSTVRVVRVEVHHRAAAGDPEASAVVRRCRDAGVTLDPALTRTARVYLLESAMSDEQLERVLDGLLIDRVVEEAVIGVREPQPGSTSVEVHPLPGVMDPAAQSIEEAIRSLLGAECRAATGMRYDLGGVDTPTALRVASRVLANAVVQRVTSEPHYPEALPKGTASAFEILRVPITDLDDAGLARLSREGHLFLDQAEMQAIQQHYRALRREPTDIELETLAQTWSEHCVHKTLKATIRYRGATDDRLRFEGRPGHEIVGENEVVIRNLLKCTVAAATHELIADGVDWTLSVFVDNAGIISFDEKHAVCVKVETHNHPSALEPYGGAATGIGGCIRDIIGTGLAAKPVASTDVFCVAPPDIEEPPAGCIHPGTVLREVVAGVRDYGNRMGVPTINGAVYFDDRYIGNPLVYCGCIGVLPNDLTHGEAKPGDLIVALGGRTGRDGIHGATFSSAELTDQHADEFSHAVQIGNPIEEKRLLDAILRARDEAGGPLFTAITDCGAGGFSSAVGEMGEAVGAEVQLDRAPLKYDGLTYAEVWISEAQERMVLAVPPDRLDRLREICDEERVELAVLGRFGTTDSAGKPELRLRYDGHEVGRLPMHFLHEGLPDPQREAEWAPTAPPRTEERVALPPLSDRLPRLLSHPNIASKHWVVRQYDHEVQGSLVVRPLVGPGARGPGDASVVQPVPGSPKGLAIGCGLATQMGDPETGGDPYLMTLAAIDECVRNLVCVGADPDRVAILDNFCWPSCKKPQNLGSLVRAAEACYDGAKAYRTPFVSGKDSLNNQFTTSDGRTIEIPPTLLITGIGIVPDAAACLTMDCKSPSSALLLVGPCDPALGGSHHQQLFGIAGDPRLPAVDLEVGPRTARAVAAVISRGLVRSAHDVSDGGLLCAVAEMLIAGSTQARPIGGVVALPAGLADNTEGVLFGEAPSRYVLEVDTASLQRVTSDLNDAGAMFHVIGETDGTGALRVGETQWEIEALATAWRAPLDW